MVAGKQLVFNDGLMAPGVRLARREEQAGKALQRNHQAYALNRVVPKFDPPKGSLHKPQNQFRRPASPRRRGPFGLDSTDTLLNEEELWGVSAGSNSICLIILVLIAHGLQATTYVVGTCKPGLRSFSNISAALAATPAPDVVLVCPGTYPEQVEITQPVTLAGIASGNSEQAIITLPSGGLVNTTLGSGIQFAAQPWANSATGLVTVQDIIVEGDGITLPGFYAGIFYQNSSGTDKPGHDSIHRNRYAQPSMPLRELNVTNSTRR